MIDKDVCNEQIYKNGESYGVGVDLTKQQANDFCEKLTNDSEEHVYDWHYFEDVVVIKRLKKSLLDCQEG